MVADGGSGKVKACLLLYTLFCLYIFIMNIYVYIGSVNNQLRCSSV